MTLKKGKSKTFNEVIDSGSLRKPNVEYWNPIHKYSQRGWISYKCDVGDYKIGFIEINEKEKKEKEPARYSSNEINLP